MNKNFHYTPRPSDSLGKHVKVLEGREEIKLVAEGVKLGKRIDGSIIRSGMITGKYCNNINMGHILYHLFKCTTILLTIQHEKYKKLLSIFYEPD